MSTNVKEYVDGHLWGLFVLQGLATVMFGVVALFFPGLTLASLASLFAVYVTVVGVVELVHGFRDLGRSSSWWYSLLVGVVLLGVGVYLVRNPAIELSAFLVLVGALVLARGVGDLFVAAFYSSKSEHQLLWVISGVVGVVAGILLWRYPVVSGLDFVWVLGLYALLAGSVGLAQVARARE
jgi:uncharacterized membrane protein HdeD (DUF308 family)